MNRKVETFFDAITLLREDLVEEAQNYVFRRRRSVWKTFGSLAACIALVASLGMLAILPRGCGAGGADSSGSMSNSAAPPASCDSPGDALSDDANTDTAPSHDTGLDGPQSTEAGQILFTARILEVPEGELLAEPLDAFLADAGVIRIPLDGLEGLPEFYPGAVVQVLCGAVSDGAAENVASVCFLEP